MSSLREPTLNQKAVMKHLQNIWRSICIKHCCESNPSDYIGVSFNMNSQVKQCLLNVDGRKTGLKQSNVPVQKRQGQREKCIQWKKPTQARGAERRTGSWGRVDEAFAKWKQVSSASQLSNKSCHTHFLVSPSDCPLYDHPCVQGEEKKSLGKKTSTIQLINAIWKIIHSEEVSVSKVSHLVSYWCKLTRVADKRQACLCVFVQCAAQLSATNRTFIFRSHAVQLALGWRAPPGLLLCISMSSRREVSFKLVRHKI